MSYTIAVPFSSIAKVSEYGLNTITVGGSSVTLIDGSSVSSSYAVAAPVDYAYKQANTATVIANAGYAQANSGIAFTQQVYNYANTIGGGSAIDNVARVSAQTAYTLANTASANTVLIQQVNTYQNTNISTAQSTASQALTLAQAAFGQANTGLSNTGGTISNSLYITTSLGVGTAASGTTGEIRATNEITAYYSSDETLKENIVVISDALGKLKQVRGVMYDWKDSVVQSRGGLDDYFVRKHDTGVIAQDVEKVLPEVVANRPDGTKAVRYEKLAGIIIQAINELAEQVEEIKKRIE